MSRRLDAALLADWAGAAVAALERHRAQIDRINVFPVADRDTGTNMLLTMRAAVVASDDVGSPDTRGAPAVVAVAEALALGALRGARGNSGVILSQVLRGVAEAVADAGGAGAGTTLADALARASRRAAAAVSDPREGTVLSVLAAAAAAAGAAGSDRLDEVAAAAGRAAAATLRATPGLLPELARAGVVDAGGLGLCVVLDALAAVVADRAPLASLDVLAVPDPGCGTATSDDVIGPDRVIGSDRGTGPDPASGSVAAGGPQAYEVMYLLDATDAARVDGLRAALDGVGDAVAVVGDGRPAGGVWAVHVHCTDVGAALEAGIEAGRPHRIRVTPLVDHEGGFTRARAVLVLTCGPHVSALAREAGADVLEHRCPGPDGVPPPDGDGSAGDPDGTQDGGTALDEHALAGALAATGARHVALLPCDPALGSVAERAAAIARRAGQEVVVVPAASSVAGLAALAVHDPARHAADDVVAMTEAAAGTRTGVLQVARSEALTWAGRCRPGDVLGLADGEVVLIAPDVSVGALWLASRMVSAGGELITVLLGDAVPDVFGVELAAHLHRDHPEVDVVVHRGARPGVPVELGVE